MRSVWYITKENHVFNLFRRRSPHTIAYLTEGGLVAIREVGCDEKEQYCGAVHVVMVPSRNNSGEVTRTRTITNCAGAQKALESAVADNEANVAYIHRLERKVRDLGGELDN